MYAASTGTAMSGIDPDAVSAWVHYGWRGHLSQTNLSAASQISYSVKVSQQIDRPAPSNVIRNSLAHLYSSGGYKFDRSDLDPHPTATSLALEAMETVGIRPPRAVRRNLLARLHRLGRSGRNWLAPNKRAKSISTLVSAAYVAVARHDRGLVQRLTNLAADSFKNQEVSIITAGGLAELDLALAENNLDMFLLTDRACSATRAAALRAQMAQYSYYAHMLGCTPDGASDAPAPSLSGWVDTSLVNGDPSYLDSSLAGLEADLAGDYSAIKVAAWFKARWSTPRRNPFVEYSRLRLADNLGLSEKTALHLPKSTVVTPSNSVVALLEADLASNRHELSADDFEWLHAYGENLSRLPLGTLNVYDAAALFEISMYFSEKAWEERSVQEATSLRTNDGLFKIAPEARRVVPIAIVLGAWVTRRVVPYEAVEARGLCRASGCVDVAAPGDQFFPSLTTTLSLEYASGRLPAPGRVPLFIH